ncbi:MAG: hypothetical protein M3361_07665 [Candidatus Tectomicrobia bacterium]|nr:hypothetical protein [Candidatus Tectomicrobia bacterium]
MALPTCPQCGGELSTNAEACPTCGRPVTTRPVVTGRRWGKYDAAGLALIVVGLGLFFTGMPWIGGLAFVAGVVVVLIGRVRS